MLLQLPRKKNKRRVSGFSLIELLIALALFAMVISGLIYGYVQANRTATWSSWSLAAQSIASQGAERARAAQWNELGNGDDWPPVTNSSGTVLPTLDTNCTLDVPSNGQLIYVTNFIYVSTVSVAPPLRQIRSDCVWNFPLTSQLCTNTVVTLRAPDQ
jgi:prepilin-type N-terminal cleavage/methylation domain-containing protein